jgi:hypothetical protein
MKIITIKRASDSAIISTIAQIGNPASDKSDESSDLLAKGSEVGEGVVVFGGPF